MADATSRHARAGPPRRNAQARRIFQRLKEYWIVAAAAIAVIVAVAAFSWWLNAREYESTDDATIDTRIVHIASPVPGTITKVLVTDNQRVTSGAALAEVSSAPQPLAAASPPASSPAATDGTITIRAPVAGRVSHLLAAAGGSALPGQELMALVPEDFWVTANFEETQLTDMRAGMAATVSIDAYPGRTFPARIDSFQSGTGQAFSLLPPENATGTFVKTTQRVPVKVVFVTPPKVDPALGPGMSAEVRVKVR
jgi:multidrug resistance efflux pump